MTVHSIWSSSPASLTAVHDGPAIRVANAFYLTGTGTAGWQITGGRIYVPDAFDNTTGFSAAIWLSSTTDLADAPAQQVVLPDLAPYKGGYYDFVFDTPIDFSPTGQSFWIGYLSNYDYFYSSALDAQAISASDGSPLHLPSTSGDITPRALYHYVGGASASASFWWGVDVHVNDGITPPTTSAGIDQVNIKPFSTVTLSATDTAGTNPITSSSWDWVSGGSAPTVTTVGTTATFEAPTSLGGLTMIFRRTVSDGTLVATSDVSISILPASQRVVVGGVEVPARLRVASDI